MPRLAVTPCSEAASASVRLRLAAGQMQLLLLTCKHSQQMPWCGTTVGIISVVACVCPAVQLKVTCGARGLSVLGAASAVVSSSSHVTRLPQPSRDIRRLARRRLQHDTDRQWPRWQVNARHCSAKQRKVVHSTQGIQGIAYVNNIILWLLASC